MRVFVPSTAGYVTGGPEAMHQLVDAGQRLGYDVAMVYSPEGHSDPVPPVFRGYRIRTARRIADAPDCVVVEAETSALQLLAHHHATRVLSWLSVDHFRNAAEQARPAAGAASPHDAVFDPAWQVVHVAQSEYARQYLAAQGCQARMLTDYIRDDIVARAQQVCDNPKEDIVAFNPRKGLEFTRALIAASPPSIRWEPIQNMSPVQVADLLGRAKVYVDFGSHPGRDRIPREAALCGCVVITGTQGSAAFEADVPLPGGHKFDERLALGPAMALRRIETVMRDHAAVSQSFEPYRQWVRDQRRVFFGEVHRLMATLEARLARRDSAQGSS